MASRRGRPVRSVLARHAHKMSGTTTGLSPTGIGQSWGLGERLPKGRQLKAHAGKATRLPAEGIRVASTADIARASYLDVGGKLYPALRLRRELGFDAIRNLKAGENLVKKLGEVKVLRMWLDGKLSPQLLAPANEVADAIIRRRFGLGQRIARLGAKDKLLLNTTHSWILKAVFERLTGARFDRIAPGIVVRPTEAMEVIHYKNGKAILTYRGKRFDVTQRLDRIVKEYPKKGRNRVYRVQKARKK